ncbi:MAG: IS982 family transposase, partial [Acidobacteria bacterium]|nr:IS982 family transposase [Acidobacteriota bacterium]
MDRDTFIITVYCLVVEDYQLVKESGPIRRGGFLPALTDEEVITMEICGAYFKLQTDRDLFAYFLHHYQHFFPALKDRPAFVRQAANLWHVKVAIWRLIVHRSGQAQASVQVIDTLPLPVCTYTRSRRERCFKTVADYGHCAAKKLDYYGFKLGLRVSPIGMITHFPLLNARAHDVTHLNALVEGFEGLCPADKGFIDPFRQPLLLDRYGVKIVAPAKSNMTEAHPRP